MKEINQQLINAITTALHEAEAAGDLVLTTSTPAVISKRVSEKVREVFAGDLFTPAELMAISGLIMHATADKRFYDWEMPTLIGYTAEEMQELGKRIREVTSL